MVDIIKECGLFNEWWDKQRKWYWDRLCKPTEEMMPPDFRLENKCYALEGWLASSASNGT